MKALKPYLFGLILAAPTQALAWGWDCSHSKDFKNTVSLSAGQAIQVHAGAGSLEIKGRDIDEVRISAEMCSADEEELEKLTVLDKVEDGELVIRTFFPKTNGWKKSGHSRIDLVLEVPKSAVMKVWDSSGEAEVADIADLDMVDSSGALDVENISGNVKIKDSSGQIDVDEVGGDVTISDSSGAIDVSDVQGQFVVLVDSSGSIEGKRIGKDMIVKIDSSGSIEADRIGGDFIVEKDGSGGIDYEDVKGEVRLPK